MTQVASRRIYPTHESVHFLIFIHTPVVNATAATPGCHFATRGGRRHVLGGMRRCRWKMENVAYHSILDTMSLEIQHEGRPSKVSRPSLSFTFIP